LDERSEDGTTAGSPQPRWAVRGVLALVVLGCAAHLLSAEPPWALDLSVVSHDRPYLRWRDSLAFLWVASAVNAGAALVLLALSGRWARRAPVEAVAAWAPGPGGSRVFRALVLSAMATLVVLAWVRLDQSLWTDEAYSAVHAIVGNYYRDKESGEVEFRPVGWPQTFWHYREPNNHVPFSVLSHVSAKAYAAWVRPESPLRVERGIRAPAYLAGILGVGALAFFLRRIGYPAAGIFAAWLLALHPWFLRYVSEARGYSLLLLSVPLYWMASVAALHRGTWGRWGVWGASSSSCSGRTPRRRRWCWPRTASCSPSSGEATARPRV